MGNDPRSLADDDLVRCVSRGVLMNPCYADHELALLERAEAGSLVCLRGVIELLSGAFMAGQIPTAEYVLKGERYARAAGVAGNCEDWCTLAGFLSVKAAYLASIGDEVQCAESRAEAAVLLGRMADAAPDPGRAAWALACSRNLAAMLPPSLAAEVFRTVRQLGAVVPRHEPEVARRAALTVGEWPERPATRWGRLKWWLADRKWDARCKWWDLKDALGAKWRGK